MEIDFSKVDDENFVLSERVVCGKKAILICPKKTKHVWSNDQLHYRSVLCSSNGKIICSGLPKFFNYGEMESSDLITRQGIMSGKSKFFNKLDGSLIIRTIINGEVNFRTRGCHNLGDFEEEVLSLIKDRYPILLDPTFGAAINWSMLFEYTSPNNRIILAYRESSLTFLGAMLLSFKNLEPRFYPAFTFEKLSQRMGTEIPAEYNMPNSIDEVIKEVQSWDDSEGIIVGTPLEDGSYHLSKVKTQEYLRLHSLRYHLSDSKIEQICWANDIMEEDTLRKYLSNLGLDWEITSFVSVPFNNYLSSRSEKEAQLATFLKNIDDAKICLLETKKEKVLALKDICEEDSPLFSIGIYYLTASSKYPEAVKSFLIGISYKTLSSYLEGGKVLECEK